MSTNKINFTKTTIQKIPLPVKGKNAYWYDTKTRGLGIRVTSAGTRTFLIYRRFNGQPERINLGRFPDLTIEEARGIADDYHGMAARGGNPAGNQRALKTEMTFGQFFDEYMERHSKIHKKTHREDRNQYNRYLKTFGKRKLSAIRQADIQKIHIRIGGTKGHYAANRLLALVRSVFNRASDWGFLTNSNPTSGIKRYKEQPRDRFLQRDELPRFWKAVAEEPNETIRDFFMVAILTGVRKANVMSMRWADINFQRQEWRINETKNDEPQSLPLTKPVLQILSNRKSQASSVFVFPGVGKTGHLIEPKSGLKRIIERAGLERFRIHDLRRTLGSWQTIEGASLQIVGKTLNHKSQAATAIYAKLDTDPVRRYITSATEAMLATTATGDHNRPKNTSRRFRN